ncbi:MAG: SMP-30/gluconolactonase/LRE family protein [Sphingomicrobium sp.]
MHSEPELVWNVAAELGEGPIWVDRDQALWFTDIKKQTVHRFVPATGDKRSWDAPEQVGFVVPVRSGGFVAGLQSGLYRFSESDGAFAQLIEVEPQLPDNRLNDAVVDPSGALWFGTMDNQERAKSGSFYRFDDGELRPSGIADIAITNGPAVSPDGRLLYYVDTLRGTIHVCDIASDGGLSAPRPFVRIDRAEGYPDGPTIDSEGCVWISLYAGWEARRYSPAGELLQHIRFPVANITKIAFGGPELRTAYATTARQLLTPEEIDRQPLAGGLFAFEVEVPGIASPLMAM